MHTILVVTAPAVVILAAGQGTRMRSAVQKLLHPLCGRPIIEWPVAAARAAGAGKIVVVDGPERRLESTLNGSASLAVQEQPLGTADAVRAAIDQLSGADTVVVVNGDAPLITAESLRALVQAHADSGAAATIATMVLADPSGYGRVVRAADGTVERVVETKAAGDATEAELAIREVNTGMFAFDGGALAGALAEVRADNAQGEHYLPDVLPIMRAHDRIVGAYQLSDPDELLGINDRVQLAEVAAVAQRQIHERHMLAGVTIVNPAATVIDADVTIGQDSVIAPFTSLHGTTAVGSGSTVGPNSTLIDATVGDGANVLHAYVTDAIIGDRAKRRAVLLPAARHGPARGVQGRHVRGDQELRRGPGHEGAPPLLHRRRRHRGGHQPGRQHDHRQLRRVPQAPHDDRQPGQDERRHHVRGAGVHRG